MPATMNSTEGNPTMYDDDKVRAMHPRQQAILMPLAPSTRQAIVNRGHLLMNTTPGIIFSQALQMALRDLERCAGDLDLLAALDCRDAHAAMRACGCAACTRDSKGVNS